MTENTEVALAGPELLVPLDDAHAEAIAAEKSLWKATIWGTADRHADLHRRLDGDHGGRPR